MTKATKSLSPVAIRYARALIDLALETKKQDKVEKNLIQLEQMIRESQELSSLVASPLLAKQKQETVMFALADKAKFEVITKNFIGVLVRNGRLSMVFDMVRAYLQEMAVMRGQVSVNVTTAQKLPATQMKTISSSIADALGKDVIVTHDEKPEILGGMVVTVGSHMIDDSVARKIERLKSAMKSKAEAA